MTESKFMSESGTTRLIQQIKSMPDQLTIDYNETDGLHVIDGSITSDKLANGAVTSDKIAEGGITGDNIADGSITADKIAGGLSGNKFENDAWNYINEFIDCAMHTSINRSSMLDQTNDASLYEGYLSSTQCLYEELAKTSDNQAYKILQKIKNNSGNFARVLTISTDGVITTSDFPITSSLANWQAYSFRSYKTTENSIIFYHLIRLEVSVVSSATYAFNLDSFEITDDGVCNYTPSVFLNTYDSLGLNDPQEIQVSSTIYNNFNESPYITAFLYPYDRGLSANYLYLKMFNITSDLTLSIESIGQLWSTSVDYDNNVVAINRPLAIDHNYSLLPYIYYNRSNVDASMFLLKRDESTYKWSIEKSLKDIDGYYGSYTSGNGFYDLVSFVGGSPTNGSSSSTNYWGEQKFIKIPDDSETWICNSGRTNTTPSYEPTRIVKYKDNWFSQDFTESNLKNIRKFLYDEYEEDFSGTITDDIETTVKRININSLGSSSSSWSIDPAFVYKSKYNDIVIGVDGHLFVKNKNYNIIFDLINRDFYPAYDDNGYSGPTSNFFIGGGGFLIDGNNCQIIIGTNSRKSNLNNQCINAIIVKES